MKADLKNALCGSEMLRYPRKGRPMLYCMAGRCYEGNGAYSMGYTVWSDRTGRILLSFHILPNGERISEKVV